jgi:hypothetical protein
MKIQWVKTGRRGFEGSSPDGQYRLAIKEGPDQWFWSVHKGRRIIAAHESPTHILAARAAERYLDQIMPPGLPPPKDRTMSRDNAIALVRHGRAPAKMLTAGSSPRVVVTSGEEVQSTRLLGSGASTRRRVVKKQTSKKTSKKRSTKKASTRTPKTGQTKRVKAKNGRVMIFTFKDGKWKLTGNEPGKTSKKTSKKRSTKKTSKKRGTKKTSKKHSSVRVTKGERELARKLVEAREELARCKTTRRKKSTPKKSAPKKSSPKSSPKKSAPKKSKAREPNITAEQIIRGAGGRTKISGMVTSTTQKGKGRRARPEKVWVCAGPSYTGCGGGKKGRQGSRMIGHITDPRAIRRIKR